MRISLVISCPTELLQAQSVVTSYISQSRPLDEIILVCGPQVIQTSQVFQSYSQIIVLQAPKHAISTEALQSIGLKAVTGDVCVVTDGSSPLAHDFVLHVENRFVSDTQYLAIGYLKNKDMNYLTLCDHTERSIQEKIFMSFRAIFPYFYLVPSRTFAFRVNDVKSKQVNKKRRNDHEDILATLFHSRQLPVYTLDTVDASLNTANLDVYVQGLQDAYAREWKLFRSYFSSPRTFKNVLIFSPLYIKNLVFAVILFLLPLVNIAFSFTLLGGYVLLIGLFTVVIAIQERRLDALLVLPGYIFLRYVRAFVFAEQFLKVFVVPQKPSLRRVHFTVVPIMGMIFSLASVVGSVMFVHIFVYKVVFVLLSLVLFSNFAAQGAVYWLNHPHD